MRRFAGPTALALALALPLVGAANPFDSVVPLLRRGDTMPPTAFVNQRGEPRTFDALRGNAVAVAFVYTRCTDECPIISQKFRATLQQLGAGPYRLIEVTIDPEHDVPAVAAAYARKYGMTSPAWEFWTSSPPAIEDFDRRAGVQALATSGVQIVHNDRMMLVDPDGRISDIIEGGSWTPADLAADLRHLAGVASNLLDRIDLALGKAVAYCGGALAGRSGIPDMLATLGIFAVLIGIFGWLFRRLSTAGG